MDKLTAEMSRRLQLAILAIALGLTCHGSARAADGKLEPTGAYADPGSSDALKKALEPKGWRVSLADGAYCDIWLRAAVPVGKTDAAGAVYTWIGDSTLLGVITFARATTDFRGQSIKPGSYTVRYAVHPTDGNHMGISPIRDFLVMLPVAMDPNPDAQFKFEELTKMSTKVTGTSHPGILSLIQLASAPAAPKLETDDYNRMAFSAAIKNQSGAAMPISFVVKGHAEQ
jgi:hypothetical protein